MTALVAAERWLYGVLSATAPLTATVGTRIFGHAVPTPTAFPYVLFTLPGTADNLMTLNADRIWSEFIYAVRVVNKVESFTALESAATAIENALSKASGSNVSGVVVACVYQAPFAMTEVDRDGFMIRHLGGLYRLYVQ